MGGGGLSFWAIHEFNFVLVAKQLWWLIQSLDTLLARVMKDRYYRNSCPMVDKKFYSPSYRWKTIMSARFIMEMGLIRIVGSWTSISVWKYHWVSDVWPRPVRHKAVNYPLNMMVNHMINPVTKE